MLLTSGLLLRKGTEKAAKEIPGIEVEFRITSDGTAAQQRKRCR